MKLSMKDAAGQGLIMTADDTYSFASNVPGGYNYSEYHWNVVSWDSWSTGYLDSISLQSTNAPGSFADVGLYYDFDAYLGGNFLSSVMFWNDRGEVTIEVSDLDTWADDTEVFEGRVDFGGWGFWHDTIEGNRFNDVLYGHEGNDTLIGKDGNDSLFGGEGNDSLNGGTGNDMLNANSGSDTMSGGAGNDTYITDGRDTIIETAGGGTDTVQSSVTMTLGAELEKLVLTGNSAINGSGNVLANVITGNTAANILNGGGGSDILSGGAGMDTFVFTTKLGRGNIDKVTDFNVRDDAIGLDDAIFKGLGHGTLSRSSFCASTTGNATDSSDRILYETDTGKLFFDRDGVGGAAKVQFATIGDHLSVTSADFFVF